MSEAETKKLKEMLEAAAEEAMRIQTGRWAKNDPAAHHKVLTSIGAALLALPLEPLDPRFPAGKPIWLSMIESAQKKKENP